MFILRCASDEGLLSIESPMTALVVSGVIVRARGHWIPAKCMSNW